METSVVYFLLFLPVQQKSTDKNLKPAVIDADVLDLPDLYSCDVFKGNSVSRTFERKSELLKTSHPCVVS